VEPRNPFAVQMFNVISADLRLQCGAAVDTVYATNRFVGERRMTLMEPIPIQSNGR